MMGAADEQKLDEQARQDLDAERKRHEAALAGIRPGEVEQFVEECGRHLQTVDEALAALGRRVARAKPQTRCPTCGQDLARRGGACPRCGSNTG